MKETIKVKGETIEQARTELMRKIPEGTFVLKRTEFNPWKPTYETGYCMADTVEEAIEDSKKQLPDPFGIKGEIIPELKSNTHIMIPVLVKAENDWQSKFRAEEYIKNKYFCNAGHGVAEFHYKVTGNEIEQKGFKGLFGAGKQEDTYKVTFYMKPEIRLRYSMWPHIIAEITDSKVVAEQQLIKYSQRGSYDSKGIRELVSRGIDINYSDTKGKNALIYSSECKDTEMILFLIENGIDINHCDNDGRNALFYSYDNYQITKLLIDKGIDFKKTDNRGDSVLTYQVRRAGYVDEYRFNDEIGKFLRENGVKADKKLISELNRKHEKELQDQKIWCPGCGKMVLWRTEGYDYDDGWMQDVDVLCNECGTLIHHYRGQTRY